MRRKLSDSNDLLRQTQKMFGQFIDPTIIPRAQFYKLFKPKMAVGEGAYGTIKCVQNCYSEPYAIKESKDTEDTYGLYRQFSVMKKFNHPHLLKAIGFFQVKETHKLIILTEFCKYKSLNTFSSYLPSLSLQEKVRLSVQIFNGIYALHQKNIMHRDLKPQNILIDQNKRAKICDFGFSTYDNSTILSKTQRVGTPLYNSPQTDQGTYTKKCDIFSYGLIVYYIFSNGKHLFKKNEVSKDLESLRYQHFKKSSKSFQEIDAPDKIKYLLDNTITEKQQKRYSTEQVRQLWQKFITHNNMKGLKVGELKENYGSMIFLNEQDQNLSERKASNLLKDHQKLALDLILRHQSHSNAIKDIDKISRLWRSVAITQKSMAEFKASIEKIVLTTAEKHIMSFGCMLILQIHFEILFEIGIRFLEFSLLRYSQQLETKVQQILKKIIQMRSVLGKNLTKSVIYLQRHQQLLKPYELFSSFMINCFQQSNKIQKLVDSGLTSQAEIENFKAKRTIDSNRLLFETVLKQCKINIDGSKFKVEFQELIKRFRTQKCNLSNLDQIKLADEMLNKIKSIQFLKI